MHNDYKDIRDLTDAEPLWHDENGVPRYCPFSPLQTANIYAKEAVLLLVACQNCGREFEVCMSRSGMEEVFFMDNLASLIEGADIRYGDPPNINCCAAGPTMNSVPIRVLEYWRRDPATATGWFRMSDLEINVTPYP